MVLPLPDMTVEEKHNLELLQEQLKEVEKN